MDLGQVLQNPADSMRNALDVLSHQVKDRERIQDGERWKAHISEVVPPMIIDLP